MQHADTKRIQAWLGGKDNLLRIVQVIKSLLSWQMVYAQTKICARKRDP